MISVTSVSTLRSHEIGMRSYFLYLLLVEKVILSESSLATVQKANKGQDCVRQLCRGQVFETMCGRHAVSGIDDVLQLYYVRNNPRLYSMYLR